MLPRLAALAEQVTDEVTHDTLSTAVFGTSSSSCGLPLDPSARQPALDCLCDRSAG